MELDRRKNSPITCAKAHINPEKTEQPIIIFWDVGTCSERGGPQGPANMISVHGGTARPCGGPYSQHHSVPGESHSNLCTGAFERGSRRRAGARRSGRLPPGTECDPLGDDTY